MARARKLFPSYGSALAVNLLARLDRDRVVHEFVSSYVAQYERPGILGGPLRDRELGETIGREAMLASIHEVRRRIPQFFGKRGAAGLNPGERENINAFFREFMDALGRSWRWSPEDRRHFLRDLAMYSSPARRTGKGTEPRKRAVARPHEAPFVARVALLLDPSMLDQARKIARRFHGEIEQLAQKVLRETLRPSR